MDCRHCQPLLADYSVGQLPEAERGRVDAHLAAGCPDCARVLRESEETWVLLADALPPVDVPDRLQTALRARLAQSRGGPAHSKATDALSPPVEVPAAASPSDRPRSLSEAPRNGTAAWPAMTPVGLENDIVPRRASFSAISVLAAAVLLGVTTGLLAWLWQGERGELQGQDTPRPEQIERFRRDLARLNDLAGSSRLRLASLQERGRQAAERGCVVWDQISRQVHFFAFDMPPLTVGRVYRIWLVGNGVKPMPAGILVQEPGGSAGAVVDVPREMGNAFRIAVTDEPADAPLNPAAEPWLTSEIE